MSNLYESVFSPAPGVAAAGVLRCAVVSALEITAKVVFLCKAARGVAPVSVAEYLAGSGGLYRLYLYVEVAARRVIGALAVVLMRLYIQATGFARFCSSS